MVKTKACDLDKETLNKQQSELYLKLLNNILRLSEKVEIDNITDFELNRPNVIKNSVRDMLLENEEAICKLFDKDQCGWYKRTPNWSLNFIRRIAKLLDYKFVSKNSYTSVEVDGKKYNASEYAYNILK
jgi:hypothetical protein